MPTSEDIQFGQVALANGMITQEQLTECLDSQELLEQMNMQESLSNILLKKGYMSKDQVEIILQMMGKKTEATKIGGYEILEKLGEGGMGMVYKAKQINMDRIVALKILSPSFAKDPSYIERFFREARSAGKLDHPNIVRGIDVGEAEGYYYFSMEYVEGETLSQYLERVGKLNERAAAMVVIQVAKALDHAHQNGIIHRDIKPDNIFLSKSNVVKLGDLGLAKPEGDVSLTAIGIPVGTPCYISPEQATNAGDVDIRSDIYSLGITLYQMLTGSVPHQETGYLDAMQKRVQEELPPVTTLNPNLSKEIVFILEKMTRLNREERFQTPKALITTIQNYLRGGKLSPDGSHILPPQAKPKSMFRVHDHPSLEATRPLETQPPHRLTPVSNEAPPSNPLENQPPKYSPITSSLKPPKDIPLEFSEDTKEEFHLPSQIPPLEIEPPTEMEELASPSSSGTEIDFEETRATMAAAPALDEAPLHIAPKLQPAKEKESPKSSPKTKIQGPNRPTRHLKSKVSDRIPKRSISERLQKERSPSYKEAPKKGKPLLLLFLLLLAAAGGGGYFYYLEWKKNHPSSPHTPNNQSASQNGGSKTGTGTGTGTGSGTSTGVKLATGKSSSKKDKEKEIYNILEATISLLLKEGKNHPEKYLEALKLAKKYLNAKPTHPAIWMAKASTLLQNIQAKFEKASLEAFQKIKQKIEEEYISKNRYKAGEEYGREKFPYHIFQNSPAKNQLDSYLQEIRKEAKKKFDIIKSLALGLAKSNKFDEARLEIKKAYPFGYYDDQILSILESIDKMEKEYIKRQKEKEALERLKANYILFATYFDRYFSNYEDFIQKREFDEAIERCQRQLLGLEDKFRKFVEVDLKWLKQIKEFYKEVRDGAERIAANNEEIQIQINGKNYRGLVNLFAGRDFKLVTPEGKKIANLILEKIHPWELYQVFISSEKKEKFKVALAALLLWDGHFSKASSIIESLQREGMADATSLAFRKKLLKRHLLEMKFKKIAGKALNAYEQQNWSELAHFLKEMESPQFKNSFTKRKYLHQIQLWSERVEMEMAKSPVNLDAFSGKKIPLWEPKVGLDPWKTTESSWWSRNDFIIGLRKGGWLVRKKLEMGKNRSILLQFLQTYHLKVYLRLPHWEKVKGDFLEVILPYYSPAKKKSYYYSVLIGKKRIQVQGAKKKGVFPFNGNLSQEKGFQFSIQKNKDTLAMELVITYQGGKIGALLLEDIQPRKLSFSQKGISFHLLINGERTSALEIRRIYLYIPKD